ncbi:DUF664 domain-containing protein [Nakamurella sp. YIM 132087]|uniref:DUF664 domain-containing protein n=1 Tax=Nakamurella alba TaxID=2665158 RepID=A0A7K1FNA0_9ACTN|nr:DinB family protein [Nakamurella alba]MTD15647.1 DUF664 domain-containing protein [Nakamurella alba]
MAAPEPDEYHPLDEKRSLEALLDQQRDAVLRKVRGVPEQDARRAPTASALTLLGLLKHCAVWEQRWFQGVMAGRPLDDGWPERRDPGADFRLDDSDTVGVWVLRYQQAIEESRRTTADHDLDTRCARPDVADCNLRYLLHHLIEETARHAGHADILRESIDGSTGM